MKNRSYPIIPMETSSRLCLYVTLSCGGVGGWGSVCAREIWPLCFLTLSSQCRHLTLSLCDPVNGCTTLECGCGLGYVCVYGRLPYYPKCRRLSLCDLLTDVPCRVWSVGSVCVCMEDMIYDCLPYNPNADTWLCLYLTLSTDVSCGGVCLESVCVLMCGGWSVWEIWYLWLL